MDADTTVVIVGADSAGLEGGDMECSRSYPLCLVQVPHSTGYTRLARLTIVTGTGMIITKTLGIDLDTLGEPGSMITLQISAIVSTLQPTGSGDEAA